MTQNFNEKPNEAAKIDMPSMVFDGPYVTTEEQARQIARHCLTERPVLKYKHVAQPKQPTPPKFDYAEIAATYSNGATLELTAETHNCSIGTVRQSLKRCGVKPRGREYKMNPVDKIVNPRRERPRSEIHVVPEQVKPVTKAYPNRDELLKLAVSSCKKLGGMAEIGSGYVIVDTSQFEITEKS